MDCQSLLLVKFTLPLIKKIPKRLILLSKTKMKFLIRVNLDMERKFSLVLINPIPPLIHGNKNLIT